MCVFREPKMNEKTSSQQPKMDSQLVPSEQIGKTEKPTYSPTPVIQVDEEAEYSKAILQLQWTVLGYNEYIIPGTRELFTAKVRYFLLKRADRDIIYCLGEFQLLEGIVYRDDKERGYKLQIPFVVQFKSLKELNITKYLWQSPSPNALLTECDPTKGNWKYSGYATDHLKITESNDFKSYPLRIDKNTDPILYVEFGAFNYIDYYNPDCVIYPRKKRDKIIHECDKLGELHVCSHSFYR